MSTVLHLTRDFPPRSKGGISTAVGGMVQALMAAGQPCAVISFDGWRPRARPQAASPPPQPHDEAGVPVLRVESPADLPAAKAFAQASGHGRGPGLIHVHHSMLWPFAAELRQHFGVAAIKQVHVAHAVQNRLRGVSATMSLDAQRIALAQADWLIAPSRAAAEAVIADVPGAGRRLSVISLGVWDSEEARLRVRERARLHGERVLSGPLLYVGRLADMNGTAELFAIAERVIASRPQTEIVIAGGVPDNPKSERRWFKRWYDHASVAARRQVRFTGWLPSDELSHLYRDAAVLIAPSWFETFGLVVAEAMLWGLPVCAARAGALSELIDDGVTGLLCEPRNIASLADAALRLLENGALACALGSRAAQAVRDTRLWHGLTPDVIALYRALGMERPTSAL